MKPLSKCCKAEKIISQVNDFYGVEELCSRCAKTFVEWDIFEEFAHTSNSELLSKLIKAVLAEEHCIKINSCSAHNHREIADMIREVVLSRMHSPEVVKLTIK